MFFRLCQFISSNAFSTNSNCDLTGKFFMLKSLKKVNSFYQISIAAISTVHIFKHFPFARVPFQLPEIQLLQLPSNLLITVTKSNFN